MYKLLTIFLIVTSCNLTAQSLGKERIERLNSSVVRILIDGKASGTGFFVSEDGILATCWHVFENALVKDSTGRVTIKKIEAEFRNGEKTELTIADPLKRGSYNEEITYDYAILFVKRQPKTKIISIKIGKFGNISEGDQIYASGYPLGVQQPIVSTGILSTKWEQQMEVIPRSGIADSIVSRQVAWLDLTMNRGNSGGPVIKLGKLPEDDEIIGIATFILNPFANSADQLIKFYSEPRGDFHMNGLSTNEVNKLFASAISNNSIGVSGCISIQYLTIGLNRGSR